MKEVLGMKKRVLFVLPYWVRGGAEKQFRYIYEAISKYHDVDILLFNDDKSDIPHLREKFYIKNNLFDEKNKLIKLILRFKSYVKINLFIKKELPNYDVAIGHNKLLVPVMYMLKSKCNKVIFSAREADEAFSKGIIANIISRLDMVTCNSQPTYNLLKNLNNNIECINNGVEINEHTEDNRIKSIKNIGIIANISRRKNVKLVIESLRYIEDNIIVNIAGKIVDNDYYKEIKQYIKENNLQQKVKFLNYVENMDEFYSNSDIIVLPSLYEGTSNVILESFARKKIILLSDIPENTCLVSSNNLDKIVFNHRDAKDLAEKISNMQNYILYNDCIIQSIVDNNFEFVFKNYSIENMKNKYINLIDNMKN